MGVKTPKPIASNGKKIRVQLHTPEPTKTQQHMRDECDINKLVALHGITNLEIYGIQQPREYGVVPAIDYKESLDIIKAADSMFENLPSHIRNEFRGDPELYLKFMEDPANLELMAKNGLLSVEATKTLKEAHDARETALRAPKPKEEPKGDDKKDSSIEDPAQSST